MHQRQEVDVLVVIPTPASHFEMLLDVIESIRFYIRKSHRIVVIDDSGDGAVRRMLQESKLEGAIDVVCNDRPMGKQGGLFISFARAYKHCLKRYRFKVALRMDTDALITGFHLDDQALDFFEANPQAGIIGSYNMKSDGTRRKWWQWALVLLYESSPLARLAGRKRHWSEEIKKARAHGYRLGENVFGGACILSHPCLAAMEAAGYLDLEPETLLEEDVIFSLLAIASGFRLADFGMPHQSMSLGMYCLPIAKEQIVSQGKTLVHSLKKGLDGESQQELRGYFRSLRRE